MNEALRWMDCNLAIQGYRLETVERRGLRLALRLPSGSCLLLVAPALALPSPPMLVALSGLALVAGLTPRHPVDLVWNHAVRHAFAAPPLPTNPTRRRHAFKVGSAVLFAVAALFAIGEATAALALGGALLASCGVTTFTNFCVPSYLMWLHATRRPSSATEEQG